MLQIRAATVEDAACILGFIRALAEYEREPEAVEVDEATLARQLRERPPPFECLIAELAGRPVGFALFFHTYSTWRGKRGLWLEDLFVLPEARRQGIGAALLGRLAALALERDCARFEWSVLDWNTPAIDFYRSVGAQVLERWRICRITGAELTQLGQG
jgi:GNAT superfamily N-acetyltransferase